MRSRIFRDSENGPSRFLSHLPQSLGEAPLRRYTSTRTLVAGYLSAWLHLVPPSIRSMSGCLLLLPCSMRPELGWARLPKVNRTGHGAREKQGGCGCKRCYQYVQDTTYLQLQLHRIVTHTTTARISLPPLPVRDWTFGVILTAQNHRLTGCCPMSLADEGASTLWYCLVLCCKVTVMIDGNGYGKDIEIDPYPLASLWPSMIIISGSDLNSQHTRLMSV